MFLVRLLGEIWHWSLLGVKGLNIRTGASGLWQSCHTSYHCLWRLPASRLLAVVPIPLNHYYMASWWVCVERAPCALLRVWFLVSKLYSNAMLREIVIHVDEREMNGTAMWQLHSGCKILVRLAELWLLPSLVQWIRMVGSARHPFLWPEAPWGSESQPPGSCRRWLGASKSSSCRLAVPPDWSSRVANLCTHGDTS